jgi:hypothetical protein
MSKPALRSALATFLFWLALACLTGAAERRNLLTNGGFEDGLATWDAAARHELLTDKDEAFAGTNCLTGEVTRSNQHMSLRRSVTLKARNRYEFQIAARATNRTKLVLWLIVGGQRKLVSAWENVPRQWRTFKVPLSIERDGEFQLEIIAPSSHNAPAGRIWIDEVALWETEMPPLTLVSGEEGFNDDPAMAVTSAGDVYVAWNSFRDLGDSLQIARFTAVGTGLQQGGKWQIAGGPQTYVLGIAAVAAGERVFVLYAAEVQGNWDLYAVACGADGPGDPVRITRDPAVDVNPSGSWHDGRLWIAWESNRGGSRQVYVTSVRDARVRTPAALSQEPGNAYNPSLAVSSDGTISVAWHSFQENNYDIYLRQQPARGTWQATRRLTNAPNVDRHARLLADGDDLLLAYENAQVEEYFVGRTNMRRIVVARIGRQGLEGLAGYKESPLWDRSEAPSLMRDQSGRIWVAFLRPRLPRAGWDTFITCFDGQQWTSAQPLSTRKGMDRRPILARVANRWVAAFQSDNMPTSWNDVDLTPTAKSDIYLALGQTRKRPATAPAWQALAEPDEPFEAAELRLQHGEDAPTPTIEYQGQTFKLYYGDLHQHSAVSVCNRLGDQSIEEDYQFSRDINRLDFACSTDHGYNINPYLWSYTGKWARANADPDRYLTFLAEEWTSTFEEYSAEHPYGFYGHRNLILGDPYFSRWWNARNRQTPAEVWEDLRKLNADFIHIPHQLADTGNVPTDWQFADETAQPVAEIFQVRGSYEHSGTPREAKRSVPRPGYFLQDAWARGVVIGVIASPDHGGGYGKACVFSPELSRAAILESLRARRCFGTTAARMFLDVRVDGHLMGEKVPATPTGPVTVSIEARCPRNIQRIEVCRNNRFIYTNQPAAREAKLKFVDMDPLSTRSYYYVRLIQEDDEIGWSSPVWFGAE